MSRRKDPRATDRYFHVSRLAWTEQLLPPPHPPTPKLEKSGVTFRRADNERRVIGPNGRLIRVDLAGNPL